MLRRLVHRLAQQGRGLATSGSSVTPHIFNRSVKRLQRDAISRLHPESRVDTLRDEVALRLTDRLLDIKRRFPRMLDLGAGSGHIAKALALEPGLTEELVQLELSESLLHRDCATGDALPFKTLRVQGDEEHLPFPESSFDAVLSSLSLHWVNDLPGTLIQVNRSLKPDGLFLGCLFGGDTLYELRTALQLAQVEREGGIAPHVSPMTSTRDVGALLSRAGLTLTTVDIDEICIDFPSMFELLTDLQAMGESNALAMNIKPLKRDTLLAASAIYKEIYGNKDGTIPATFQILYMIGWRPDPSQPKPLPRGSGEISFKALSEAPEVIAAQLANEKEPKKTE